MGVLHSTRTLQFTEWYLLLKSAKFLSLRSKYLSHTVTIHTCCWCPENLRAELEIVFLTFSSRQLRLGTVSCLGSSWAVLSRSTIARHSGRLQQHNDIVDNTTQSLLSASVLYSHFSLHCKLCNKEKSQLYNPTYGSPLFNTDFPWPKIMQIHNVSALNKWELQTVSNTVQQSTKSATENYSCLLEVVAICPRLSLSD